VDLDQLGKPFADEVGELVKDAVDAVIFPTSAYSHAKVAVWVPQICDGVMRRCGGRGLQGWRWDRRRRTGP